MEIEVKSKTKKLLRQSIRSTVKDLKSFEQITIEHSNIILTQDAVSKELAKKNKAELDNYLKKNYQSNTSKKVDDLSDIIFRNFDIQTANIEVIKSYIDEYYERFQLLNKSLTKSLTLLERYVAEDN